jgi:hypothetical protein
MDWMPIGLIGLGAFTLADLMMFQTVFPRRTAEDALLRTQRTRKIWCPLIQRGPGRVSAPRGFVQ